MGQRKCQLGPRVGPGACEGPAAAALGPDPRTHGRAVLRGLGDSVLGPGALGPTRNPGMDQHQTCLPGLVSRVRWGPARQSRLHGGTLAHRGVPRLPRSQPPGDWNSDGLTGDDGRPPSLICRHSAVCTSQAHASPDERGPGTREPADDRLRPGLRRANTAPVGTAPVGTDVSDGPLRTWLTWCLSTVSSGSVL